MGMFDTGIIRCAYFIFMQFIFKFPPFKMGDNPAGVYRMDFDTGHFYIGSSKSVKRRIKSWRSRLHNGLKTSKFISEIIPNVKKITFTILHTQIGGDIEKVELYYLSIYGNDKLCLNRSLNPLNNSNWKSLPNHLKKVSKRKPYIPHPRTEPHISSQRKPISKYSIDFVFIETYPSIKHAALDNNVDDKTITVSASSKRIIKGTNGFIFRFANDTVKPKIGRKPPTIKTKTKPVIELSSNRNKIVLDTRTGVFYYSLKELCNLYSLKHKTMYKKLSGTSKNNTQFIYA